MKEKTKKQKGITLIALVITIVRLANTCNSINSNTNSGEWNTYKSR